MSKRSHKTLKTAIGIDLGTTNSVVGVFLPSGQVEIIANSDGMRITPSFVAFRDDERFVGKFAKRALLDDPTRTFYDAKRLMGRKFSDSEIDKCINGNQKWPFEVVPNQQRKPVYGYTINNEYKTISPRKISSIILQDLKHTAEEYLGHLVSDAVISVPANYNELQRNSVLKAAKEAGLNVLNLINEPTAAAMAYGFSNGKNETRKERNIVVYDLGGGTFDVTVLSLKKKEYDVKSSRGNQFLGGRDFDEKIVEHFIQKIQKTHPHFKDNVQMMTKLRTECEDLKLKLTRYETASITLKDNDGSVLLKDQMTRGCFEELNMKLFKETLNMVEDALDEAKMLISMIDEVVLVGGSSRIPKIKEMMKSYFEGLDLSCQINPDEAIAMGAAILAAKLSGNPSKDLKGFKLSDVTPLALGVYQEPTDCYGNRLRGTMLKIIPRNSKIPIIEEEQFETVFDNQTEWTIEIFQGESEHTSKNTMLGNFSIKNIPPRPAGKEKINLYFELDCNGILLATAQLASNIENSVVMSVDPNKHTAKMTKKEIEHMREVAKAYDLQERERQRNMKMKQEIETSP